MQTAEIQYPVAFNDLGGLVKIEDAPRQRGIQYSCVHCGDQMSAVVLVTQRKPHFRHTKSLICDPDSVLHSTAIEIIRNAHNTAQSANSPYLLTRPCTKIEFIRRAHNTAQSANSSYLVTRSCEAGWIEDYDMKHCSNNATEIDLADDWKSKTEKSIVEGTRSDLIFSHDDGREIIIEVVNTHSMEPETETAYRKSGIPVVVLHVAWETVNRLWKGISTRKSSNFASDECPGCNDERLKAEEDFKRRCKIVDRQLAKMKRQKHSRAKFRPFYEGRPETFYVKPTRIFMKTQRKVFANAIILTELGFIQSNPEKKPWLFTKTIHRTPEGEIMLYADLGGSDVIPIYKDTAALLYTSLEFEGPLKDPDMNAYIVREFGERLQKEGVQVRISFYKRFPFKYPFEPIDFKPIDVDPIPRVSRRLLYSLMRRV